MKEDDCMDEFIKLLDQDYELKQYCLKQDAVVFYIQSVKRELMCPFCGSGFRQLNHQQMLANRRNAVFFCQILYIFMLHVLYVYGIMALR